MSYSLVTLRQILLMRGGGAAVDAVVEKKK